MICKSPFAGKKGGAHPCGQCLPCTINIRRVWTHRIILEASLWPQNSFVTLTYRDDQLPDGGVSLAHHQAFMRELRARYFETSGLLIRFYMCAEYGEKTLRPHYHYALFNFPSCIGSGAVWRNSTYIPCNCSVCSFVTKVWGKGHVFIGKLSHDSAQYIAGYVTKKMTKKDDPRLNYICPDTGEVISLRPEFSKQSTRPGLAAGVVDDILLRWRASGLNEPPVALKQGDRYMPLGRYLKGKINAVLQTPPSSLQTIEARQMFSMLHNLKDDSSFPRALAQGSVAVALKLINSQRCLQTEQKFNRKGNRYEI